MFYGTDPVAQLHVVLAHPFAFVKMVIEQFQGPVYGGYMLDATIGILNWLTMMLPPDLYKLWIAGAVGAIIADSLRNETPGPSWRDSMVLILVCVATVLLVWLSEYLTWTSVGKAWIDGAQGRYLLPLIPVLGLAWPRLNFPRRGADQNPRPLPAGNGGLRHLDRTATMGRDPFLSFLTWDALF